MFTVHVVFHGHLVDPEQRWNLEIVVRWATLSFDPATSQRAAQIHARLLADPAASAGGPLARLQKVIAWLRWTWPRPDCFVDHEGLQWNLPITDVQDKDAHFP